VDFFDSESSNSLNISFLESFTPNVHHSSIVCATICLVNHVSASKVPLNASNNLQYEYSNINKTSSIRKMK